MADRYRLLGDELCMTNDDDALGFGKIATSIAELIVESAESTSLTVGIEGGWGTGKSSLMALIQAELKGDGGTDVKAASREPGWKARLARSGRWCSTKARRWGIACGRGLARAGRWLLAKPPEQPQELQINTVWFNAWTASDGDALKGLIKSVLNALDRKALRRAARNEQMMGRIRSTITMAAQFAGFGGIADRLWTVLAADPEARNQMRTLVEEAVKAWNGDGSGEPDGSQMLVVFIDDLDRCTPQNVFQVFEAMKLYLNVPRIVFVVGFDPTAVARAIKTEKEYEDDLLGDRYVEKLIQLKCQIPPVEMSQGSELVDRCIEKSRIGGAISETARRTIVTRNGHNPRRIKRFVNSFVVMHRLGELKGIEDATVVRILVLRFYFPDFFQLFNGEQNPIQAFLAYVEVRDALRGDDPAKADIIEKIAGLRKAFRIDGLSVQASRESRDLALERLETELPEALSDHVDDHEFRQLAQSLAPSLDDPQVQQLLRLIPEAADGSPSPAVSRNDRRARRTPDPDLSILWLTDDRPGATDAVAGLEDSVARLRLAHDLEYARDLLRSGRPDVLVLDASRNGNRNAGLSDLERIRLDGLFDGPALLFAARFNSERRAAARHLNASVTTSWDGLYGFLAGIKPDAPRS